MFQKQTRSYQEFDKSPVASSVNRLVDQTNFTSSLKTQKDFTNLDISNDRIKDQIIPFSAVNSPSGQLISPDITNQVLPSEPQPQNVIISMNPTQESGQNSSPHTKEELKLYLMRCVGLFVMNLIICCSVLIVANFKLSYYALLPAFQITFIYFFIESILRVRMKNRESIRVTEDKFTVADCICGTFALLCIILKLKTMTAVLILGGTPFLISSMLYLIYSETNTGLNIVNTVIRCFYGIQSILIVAQINGLLGWDPYVVFGITFGVLSYYVPFFLAFCLILVLSVVLVLLKQHPPSQVTMKTQLLGLVWNSLLFSLSPGAIVIIYRFIGIYTGGKDVGGLNRACFIFWTVNCVLTIVTIPARRSLALFLQFVWSSDNGIVEEGQLSDRQSAKKFEIQLSVDKTKKLFVMLSRTYFIPLQNKLLMNKTGININNKDNRVKRIPKAKRLTFNVKASEDTPNRNLSATLPQRMNASADDGIRMETITAANITKRDDDPCYICYDKLPDAILMKCGHGGICYECARALMKKKNECMECRKEVESIMKVDAKAKSHNIIKAIEVTNVNKVVTPKNVGVASF